jgi:hypothetical protein
LDLSPDYRIFQSLFPLLHIGKSKFLSVINKMKLVKQILSISMIVVMSSAQAEAIDLDSDLAKQLIVAETYTSVGALVVVHGNINSGTYTSVGAGITGTPTPDIAIVDGNINSGTYTSTGDSTIVAGNIHSGTATTTGASAEVEGDIISGIATTLGANSIVKGSIASGIATTLGADAEAGGTSIGAVAPVVNSLQSKIQALQTALKAMGGTTLTTGVLGADGADFIPGVYNVTDILSVTASTDITLTGNGSDQSWVFNIGNYMSLGANVNVVLNNVGPNSTVIWNILGDSTGGAGLGYASLGAGVKFKGVILANSYISVGAGSAMVTGVGNSCGGLYSATGYVSVGATSIVGRQLDCGSTGCQDSEVIYD